MAAGRCGYCAREADYICTRCHSCEHCEECKANGVLTGSGWYHRTSFKGVETVKLVEQLIAGGGKKKAAQTPPV